jgi:hypothetical protein
MSRVAAFSRAVPIFRGGLEGVYARTVMSSPGNSRAIWVSMVRINVGILSISTDRSRIRPSSFCAINRAPLRVSVAQAIQESRLPLLQILCRRRFRYPDAVIDRHARRWGITGHQDQGLKCEQSRQSE